MLHVNIGHYYVLIERKRKHMSQQAEVAEISVLPKYSILYVNIVRYSKLPINKSSLVILSN